MSEVKIAVVAGVVVGLVAWFFLWPALLAWSWNHAMPIMWHHAPHVGYWQAFAGWVLLNVASMPFRKK